MEVERLIWSVSETELLTSPPLLALLGEAGVERTASWRRQGLLGAGSDDLFAKLPRLKGSALWGSSLEGSTIEGSTWALVAQDGVPGPKGRLLPAGPGLLARLPPGPERTNGWEGSDFLLLLESLADLSVGLSAAL